MPGFSLAEISLYKQFFYHYHKYIVARIAYCDNTNIKMNLNLLTSDQLKTYYTNRWCIEQGIKNRDILNHPKIDDAILLINIRNEYWTFFNASNKGLWAALWNKVYHLQFNLKPKHLKQLEQLVITATSRQQTLEKQRQLIKANRKEIKKGVVNMTTNPTPAAESLIGF
jgi:hypothetical protein